MRRPGYFKFRSDRNLDGKGVDPPDQVGSERFVDRPVPRNPAHRREDICANPHAKMALAAGLVSGMTDVLIAFIDDLKRLRLESCLKFSAYFLRHGDFARHF